MQDTGYCPTCFTRSGPLHSYGLLYFYCLKHRFRWTVGAKFRETDPAALAAVRRICEKTVLIVYARHPNQLGLHVPSAKTGKTEEERS